LRCKYVRGATSSRGAIGPPTDDDDLDGDKCTRIYDELCSRHDGAVVRLDVSHRSCLGSSFRKRSDWTALNRPVESPPRSPDDHAPVDLFFAARSAVWRQSVRARADSRMSENLRRESRRKSEIRECIRDGLRLCMNEEEGKCFEFKKKRNRCIRVFGSCRQKCEVTCV